MIYEILIYLTHPNDPNNHIFLFYTIRCDVSVDLDPTAIQSIRSLLNPVHFFATNHVREAIHRKDRILRNKTWKVKENSLKFTSDWSLIKTRSLPCITTGFQMNFWFRYFIALLRHFPLLHHIGGSVSPNICGGPPHLSLALFREGSKVKTKLWTLFNIDCTTKKVDQAVQLQAAPLCASPWGAPRKRGGAIHRGNPCDVLHCSSLNKNANPAAEFS